MHENAFPTLYLSAQAYVEHGWQLFFFLREYQLDYLHSVILLFCLQRQQFLLEF